MALAILISPAIVLLFAAVTVLTPQGTAATGNPGPHGRSEILYAYVSTAVNNGSSFAGLSGNNLFFFVTLALAPVLEQLHLAAGGTYP